MKNNNRISVSLLLLGGALGLFGCGGGEDVDPSTGLTIVRVNASALERVPDGEKLVIDLREAKLYQFDYSERPLDFDRIELIDQEGTRTDVESWLSDAHLAVEGIPSGLPLKGFRLIGALPPSDPLPDPFASDGMSHQGLRRSVRCSDDGRLCLECWYTDQGNLLYCDVYWLPAPSIRKAI